MGHIFHSSSMKTLEDQIRRKSAHKSDSQLTKKERGSREGEQGKAERKGK
jgi:hypothetical protein